MPEEVFAHPTALVESDEIGEGTRIWAFAHVMKGAVIGRGCKIGDHVFIESGASLGDRVTVKNNSLIWHGVHIEDEVFIGPNVVFTNDLTPRVRHQTSPEDWISTDVQSGASIGANATILCGVRLGANCMVGAGSVVTRDVRAHAVVIGNPARQSGWVCECGTTLNEAFSCPKCERSYRTSKSGAGLELPH